MTINLSVEITDEVININGDYNLRITDGVADSQINSNDIVILVDGMTPVAISVGNGEFQPEFKFSRTITVKTDSFDFEPIYLARFLAQTLEDGKINIVRDFADTKVPTNMEMPVNNVGSGLLKVMAMFGILLEKPKRKPAKAQHRWRKEISDISFFVNYENAVAEVKWVKRNQMKIIAGAKLRQDVPLNKDGSIGIAVKFGNQLRQEHEQQITDFVTSEDVILKSVNEVGSFLYYAGTNSWLVLKDKNGKTIDEYTVVK
ncbi:hypothetical protein [Lentilactobacillus sp. Marseille-Q4993]|uniref:hypothetical protein n=1 Tax=Lentilactobacillus sp. Marseille-Q4993 TaxID=3039492 RepID=UPI0024BD1F05|nr:hypothetical protein [Lentilactobacillus sp. Marseille-Q4993]